MNINIIILILVLIDIISIKNTDSTISFHNVCLYSHIRHFDQIIVLLKLQRSILYGASYGSYPLSSIISYSMFCRFRASKVRHYTISLFQMNARRNRNP